MSAFMVSPQCMNLVVNAVMERRNRVHSTFLTFGGVDLTQPNAAPLVAAALYGLNQQALQERYPDSHSHGGYSDIPEYRFAFVRSDSRISRSVRAYKAGQCLEYQCAEGTVPETPLYQELAALTHWLAAEIVGMLPEYERAGWG